VKQDAACKLGRLIEAKLQEIERRWLEQVQRDVSNAEGVELTQLRDGIPDYLAAMVRLLKAGDLDLLSGNARSAWADVAREHGVTRVRIGFDISQLVHEFIVLRRVIGGVIDEQADQQPDVVASKGLIADIIEAAIAAAVQAYVDARDNEARRAQAEAVGFLTHELRNPLTAALLTSAKLRAQASSDNVRLHEVLQRNLGRLGELIDSVLLTQKFQAGEVAAKPVDVELGPVIEPALEAAHKVAEAKRLQFSARYDPHMMARIDPFLTRSAIANLADNAVKYTDAGEVELVVQDQPDHIEVSVRDTCPGISPEELRTIFEPFKRGHSAKAGTGLGLAIARRAVEAQGGSISVESPGVHGCQFLITLPKRQATDDRK
jgi:signal transduction histidine kinase